MARILIVDDDLTIHRRVHNWLSTESHEVAHALHSGEARDMMRFKKPRFDIIVCDNNMRIAGEGVDFGVTLYLEDINIPFILHTSSSLHELNSVKLAKHNIMYVHKSTSPEELLSKVRELVKRMQNAAP